MMARRRALPGTVGLVPTMGFLHEGHLSLVRRARSENDHVIVSVFVNPTQFGPSEDFDRYPRDLARDLALLERERVDLVFAPPVAEVYPPGYATYVEVKGLTERLEGAFRPGFFRGVATVVAKLLAITRPDRAYFGRKDAQQLLVVRRLAADLNLGAAIVPMPTLREPDGLAMSSRNAYLSPTERQAARAIPDGLRRAEALYAEGKRDAEPLRQAVRSRLEAEPLAAIDYVSLADAETLEELTAVDCPALLSVAVRIGRTRLIDNVTLGADGSFGRPTADPARTSGQT